MSKPHRKFPGARRPAQSSQSDEGQSHAGGRRGRPKRGGGKQGRVGYKQYDKAQRPSSREDEPEPTDREIRFSDLLMTLAKRAAPDKVQGGKHPEPLARLDYAMELDLKNKALQEFWTARGLPDKPNRVLPSPRPRGYRTTTKRRVVRRHAGYELAFLSESSLAAQPKAAADSLVEPPEHKAVYSFLLAKLNTDAYHGLANSLNYLIIRGDYGRLSVFFNVHKVNADVVRKAKLLGEHLKAPEHKVASAFMFFDPSHSEFYFEARTSEGPWKLKKLFGPDDIRLQVGKRTYAFHPTAFCQVNASILPTFLEKAEQLLKPKPEYRLVDLYSGYGFFTLHLGTNYGEAWGIDLGGPGIESAQKMAAAEPGTHARFRSGRIAVKSLDKLLPAAAADKPEALLLDPPRQGTEPGVIRALAARNPARILHIFCDMDTLPKEVNQWRKAGFMVSKVVPLDMFPGTDNLEVMVLFIPDRYGILNRIDKDRFKRMAEEEAAAIELAEKKRPEPEAKPRFEPRGAGPGFKPGKREGGRGETGGERGPKSGPADGDRRPPGRFQRDDRLPGKSFPKGSRPGRGERRDDDSEDRPKPRPGGPGGFAGGPGGARRPKRPFKKR